MPMPSVQSGFEYDIFTSYLLKDYKDNRQVGEFV